MEKAAGKMINSDKQISVEHKPVETVSVATKILYLSRHKIRQSGRSCNLRNDAGIFL